MGGNYLLVCTNYIRYHCMKQIEILFGKYLAGTISDQEKIHLNNWIAGNKSLREWLETAILNSPGDLDEVKQSQILKKIHQEIRIKEDRRRYLPVWMNYAASVALMIVVATSIILIATSTREAPVSYSVIEAVRGQKTNIILPDGTKVMLNSESTLTYSTGFNNENRTVEIAGEAYFNVEKNKNLPFVVKAGKIEIEAVGTAFNVRAYSNESKVITTLVEGKVNVTAAQESIELNPNERIEVERNSFATRKIIMADARNSIGWLNDILCFENTALSEVAADLSRIYNIEIYFRDETVKNLRFTGKISNNSLSTVLRILSLTSPLSYEIRDNEVYLFEVKSETELFGR